MMRYKKKEILAKVSWISGVFLKPNLEVERNVINKFRPWSIIIIAITTYFTNVDISFFF